PRPPLAPSPAPSPPPLPSAESSCPLLPQSVLGNLSLAFSVDAVLNRHNVDNTTLAVFCREAGTDFSLLSSSGDANSTCYTWAKYYDSLSRSGLFGQGPEEYQRFCTLSIDILLDPAGTTLADVFGKYSCVPGTPCCTPWGMTPAPLVCNQLKFPYRDSYEGSNGLASDVQCRPVAAGNGGKCIVVQDSCDVTFTTIYDSSTTASAESACPTGCTREVATPGIFSPVYSIRDGYTCRNATLANTCRNNIWQDACEDVSGASGSCAYIPVCQPETAVITPQGTDTCQITAPAGNLAASAQTCAAQSPLLFAGGAVYGQCQTTTTCMTNPVNDICTSFTDPYSCRNQTSCEFIPQPSFFLGWSGRCRRAIDPCTSLSTLGGGSSSQCSRTAGCLVAQTCATKVGSPSDTCSSLGPEDCSTQEECNTGIQCRPQINDCAFFTLLGSCTASAPAHCGTEPGQGCVIKDLGNHPCSDFTDASLCLAEQEFNTGARLCMVQPTCSSVCPACQKCMSSVFNDFVNVSRSSYSDAEGSDSASTLSGLFLGYCAASLLQDGLVNDFSQCSDLADAIAASAYGGPALRAGWICNQIGRCPAVTGSNGKVLCPLLTVAGKAGSLDLCTEQGVSTGAATIPTAGPPPGSCSTDSDCLKDGANLVCGGSDNPAMSVTCSASGMDSVAFLGSCVAFCQAPSTLAVLEQLNAGRAPCSSDSDCSNDNICSSEAADGQFITTCVDSTATLQLTPATGLCVPTNYTMLSAKFDSVTGSTILVELASIPVMTSGDCGQLFDDDTCGKLGSDSYWEVNTNANNLAINQLVVYLDTGATITTADKIVMNNNEQLLSDAVSGKLYDGKDVELDVPATAPRPLALITGSTVVSLPCAGRKADDLMFDASDSLDFTGRSRLTYSWAYLADSSLTGSGLVADNDVRSAIPSGDSSEFSIPGSSLTGAWFRRNAGTHVFSVTVTNFLNGQDTYIFTLQVKEASTPQFSVVGGTRQFFSNDDDFLFLSVDIDPNTLCASAASPTWQWTTTGTNPFTLPSATTASSLFVPNSLLRTFAVNKREYQLTVTMTFNSATVSIPISLTCIGSQLQPALSGPSGLVSSSQVATFDASASKDPDGQPYAFQFSCIRVDNGAPCTTNPALAGRQAGAMFTQDLSKLEKGVEMVFQVKMSSTSPADGRVAYAYTVITTSDDTPVTAQIVQSCPGGCNPMLDPTQPLSLGVFVDGGVDRISKTVVRWNGSVTGSSSFTFKYASALNDNYVLVPPSSLPTSGKLTINAILFSDCGGDLEKCPNAKAVGRAVFSIDVNTPPSCSAPASVNLDTCAVVSQTQGNVTVLGSRAQPTNHSFTVTSDPSNVVKYTVSATGFRLSGRATPQYQYTVFDLQANTIFSQTDFATSSSMDWVGLPPGKYGFAVTVRDGAGATLAVNAKTTATIDKATLVNQADLTTGISTLRTTFLACPAADLTCMANAFGPLFGLALQANSTDDPASSATPRLKLLQGSSDTGAAMADVAGRLIAVDASNAATANRVLDLMSQVALVCSASISGSSQCPNSVTVAVASATTNAIRRARTMTPNAASNAIRAAGSNALSGAGTTSARRALASSARGAVARMLTSSPTALSTYNTLISTLDAVLVGLTTQTGPGLDMSGAGANSTGTWAYTAVDTISGFSNRRFTFPADITGLTPGVLFGPELQQACNDPSRNMSTSQCPTTPSTTFILNMQYLAPGTNANYLTAIQPLPDISGTLVTGAMRLSYTGSAGSKITAGTSQPEGKITVTLPMATAWSASKSYSCLLLVSTAQPYTRLADPTFNTGNTIATCVTPTLG
ncbi:REJ domain-containing protein, partial [Haematococcus lacustris]